MLRRGFAALMMGVVCAGSVTADDAARNQDSAHRPGILNWLRQKPVASTGKATMNSAPAGITHAVVEDAERQAAQVQIRQTSNQPDEEVVAAEDASPRPVPIEQAPVVPNMDAVSGPQYFSATASASTTVTSPVPVHPSDNWQQFNAPVPVYATSAAPFTPISNSGMAGPVIMNQGMVSGNVPSGQYPMTGASLYPAPVPGIPHQIGGTLIPNQAFHPHEMLYEHKYRAMYPPYYYKVNGGWMVTPFGVWSHEDWKLQGTTVEVNYKSSISPFSFYKRPPRR
ncbi:MAG: hypothetical protein KDA91_11705 [Planctomycetaceae bacterium]|nr:hypothetical protein [Planctomycetaceae bacterium]